MSFAWAFLGSNKKNVFLGAIYIGFFMCLTLGLPLLLIIKYYEYDISVLYGIIFVIVIFSISVYIFHKAGMNRLKKK